VSLAFAIGGSDTITSADDDDIVIGGQSDDDIAARNGRNIVIGDSGKIRSAVADTPDFSNHPLTLGQIETLAFGIGGPDLITTGTGRDIVLGGHLNDTITVSDLLVSGADDHNIVLGDDGFILYDRDLNSGDIDEIASLSTTFAGGSDTITSTGGDDIIIAGRFGDDVHAGDGDNVVIGDSGQLLSAVVDTFQQFAGQPMTIALITTNTFADGGNDTVVTGIGEDIVLAGMAADHVTTSAANDVVLGDNGFVDYVVEEIAHGLTQTVDIDVIRTLAPNDGGNDTILSGSQNDIVFGGTGLDTITGGGHNDLIFGDHAEAVATDHPGVVGEVEADLLPLQFPIDKHPFRYTSIFTQNSHDGNNDLIFGDDGTIPNPTAEFATDGQDIILGQQGVDTVFAGGKDDDVIGGHNVANGQDAGDDLDGGSAVDVITGDNAFVLRTGSPFSDRFRILAATTIYDVNGNAGDRGGSPTRMGTWSATSGCSTTPSRPTRRTSAMTTSPAAPRTIASTVSSATTSSRATVRSRSSSTVRAVFASSDPTNGVLTVVPSFERANDGEDYIEAGGGNDIVFGGLGQDDIIGGSSELFFDSPSPNQRPDGEDILFGGAGLRINRYDLGQGGDSVVSRCHHSSTPTHLGDNANPSSSMANNGGDFLTFVYDSTDDIGSDQRPVRGAEPRPRASSAGYVARLHHGVGSGDTSAARPGPCRRQRRHRPRHAQERRALRRRLGRRPLRRRRQRQDLR
jgi:Ca2+-binding RTX toxin-like protein